LRGNDPSAEDRAVSYRGLGGPGLGSGTPVAASNSRKRLVIAAPRSLSRCWRRMRIQA